MGTSSGNSLLPFFLVFVGCMASIIFIEYVLQGDPKAGNFINATEFVFVLVQSIPGRLVPGSLSLRPLKAPLSSHAIHALLWVSMSTLANYVFAYNIKVPIHTLFRSCNTIASLVLGFLFFSVRYSIQQVGCVLVVTVGIFLASIGDAKKFSSAGCTNCGFLPSSDASEELGRWTIGIIMLVCVQIIQATLGHTQAIFYKRYANPEVKEERDEVAEEYMFTSHVVSLLMILALWEDITDAAKLAVATPVIAPWLPIPRRIAWMVLNNFTQLMCIKGVFRLSANYTPLTVTITLSVRKFLSVIVSAWWFGNPWTSLHSFATVLIFGGVFAYRYCPDPMREKEEEKKKAE